MMVVILVFVIFLKIVLYVFMILNVLLYFGMEIFRRVGIWFVVIWIVVFEVKVVKNDLDR